MGGAREKQTLCEKTLLAQFEYLRTHVSENGLECKPERQNIAIHLHRKHATISDRQICLQQLNGVLLFFTRQKSDKRSELAERSPTYSSTCVILEQAYLTNKFLTRSS